MRIRNKIKNMGVGPFCKIKINEELKLKLKEDVFGIFNILGFNRKKKELIKINY